MNYSDTNKPRFDTAEAAEFICCATVTLKISRVTGILLGVPAPAYRKLGRKVVYDRDTLQAWIDQFGTQTSTAV